MLGDVNKHFVFKILWTAPSNVLLLHLKQTFPPIVWIFTDGEGDGIESRLSSHFFFYFELNHAWIRGECFERHFPVFHHAIWIISIKTFEDYKSIFTYSFALDFVLDVHYWSKPDQFICWYGYELGLIAINMIKMRNIQNIWNIKNQKFRRYKYFWMAEIN